LGVSSSVEDIEEVSMADALLEVGCHDRLLGRLSL